MSSTHNGNNSGVQYNKLTVSNRINARAIPKYAIQRGKIPVRSARVQVEIMNTPAIFIVYTVMIS